MTERWVKLYEKLRFSSFYHDSELVHLWIHLLFKASKFGNTVFFNGKEVSLNPGQLVTGRKTLSAETGISESKLQRGLKRFESCHMIEQLTNPRNRLITVLNWDRYQESEQQANNQNACKCSLTRHETEQQTNNSNPLIAKDCGEVDSKTEQQTNSLRTTGEQPANTIKKGRKKERKNKEYPEDSKEFRLSLFLLNKIRERKPDYKIPDLQKWSQHSDYLFRIDKRDPHEVKKVVEWCQRDDFWQDNILSTAKLRAQYDKLVMRMNKSSQTPQQDDGSEKVRAKLERTQRLIQEQMQ